MSVRSESPINNGHIFDISLELKDAGLVASSAAAEVDASAQVLDIGSGKFVGEVVIDATAVEVASGDEAYTIVCQFSDSATFASGVVAGASITLGDAAAIAGADTDNGIGRYVLPFKNVVNDTQYRYMRLYTVVVGTIATGVNYSAFIGRLHGLPA